MKASKKAAKPTTKQATKRATKQASSRPALLIVVCLVVVFAAVGGYIWLADGSADAANHYIAVDLQTTVDLVASGDPVVIYFRSPT